MLKLLMYICEIKVLYLGCIAKWLLTHIDLSKRVRI